MQTNKSKQTTTKTCKASRNEQQRCVTCECMCSNVVRKANQSESIIFFYFFGENAGVLRLIFAMTKWFS